MGRTVTDADIRRYNAMSQTDYIVLDKVRQVLVRCDRETDRVISTSAVETGIWAAEQGEP